MARTTFIYPADGSEPYELGSRPIAARPGDTRPAILPDLADFVSPLDGKRYSGRRGLRVHNLRHDVVPNADLKGLPTLTTNSDQRTPEQKKASADQRKQMIINQVNQYYR